MVCSNFDKRIDIRRKTLCDACPRLDFKIEWERETERLWNEWLEGEDRSDADFKKMLPFFYNIVSIKSMPDDRQPAFAAKYIEAITSEEERYRRSKE